VLRETAEWLAATAAGQPIPSPYTLWPPKDPKLSVSYQGQFFKLVSTDFHFGRAGSGGSC